MSELENLSADVRLLLEAKLSQRQFDIFLLLQQGKNQMRITQILRWSLSTIEKEVAAIKRKAADIALEAVEGQVRTGVTISSGRETMYREDVVVCGAARRERRRNRFSSKV